MVFHKLAEEGVVLVRQQIVETDAAAPSPDVLVEINTAVLRGLRGEGAAA
jgi:hypothetical protein